MNLNKPADSNVLLQRVVESDDVVLWPALVLEPVGTVSSPKSNFTFNLKDSFLSVLETLKYAHSQGIIHNDIRPENIIILEGGKWLLIDWAAAWELKSDEEVKREYFGCVTFASDLVLTQLAECRESVRDDNSYMYVINAPSILSDIISLFRTQYVFTFRISNKELDDLMNRRVREDFIGIRTWWKRHLSKQAQETEAKLIEAFSVNPQSIHGIAANLAQELFPEIIFTKL